MSNTNPTVTGKNSVSGEQIRSYVERYERLEVEKKDISEDQKLVMAEAKAAGFDTKILRHCIKVRTKKPADYHEAQALADMYLSALGMVTEPPLFRAANRIGVDIAARESVIEALKNFVPENGSIVIEAGGAPVRLTRDKDGTVTSQEVVERPAPIAGSAPPAGRRNRATQDVPDVSSEEAEAMGAQAARDNTPIIKNPFPFGDARRPAWDKGWRAGGGNGGFGPE
jgi:uncharacterized protein (UPF0335 family)